MNTPLCKPFCTWFRCVASVSHGWRETNERSTWWSLVIFFLQILSWPPSAFPYPRLFLICLPPPWSRLHTRYPCVAATYRNRICLFKILHQVIMEGSVYAQCLHLVKMREWHASIGNVMGHFDVPFSRFRKSSRALRLMLEATREMEKTPGWLLTESSLILRHSCASRANQS